MEKSLKEHIEHFREQRELIRKTCAFGRESIHELSVITDVFLVSVFSQAERKWQKSGKGTLRSVAMVPTGGYGRSELCFHSDIDLMILYSRGTDPVADFISEQIFYPLWDSGLQIGHCIRTIDDCIEIAQGNFSTQTSFLDARCLAGNRELFKEFQKAFNGNIIDGRRRVFLGSLVEEDMRRYRIYGEAAFLLEPNVKEGKGGLRDYHSIIWTAKALFNLQSLEALENAAILSNKERAWLEESLDFFWNVRNRLHILSNRKNDQLFFEYQEDVAKAIGFKPGPESLDVEEFMKVFYSHASNIEYLTSLFFERVFHTLKIKPAAGTAQPNDLILEKDISIYKGEIRVEKPEIFAKKPYLLIKLFEYAAKYEVQLHPKTCRLITDNLHLIDDTFRSSRKVARSMLKLMSLGAKSLGPLELMLKTGLLPRYIPEFSNIVCQVQHDSYHLYTVDKHSLLTFLELNLLLERNAGPFAGLKEPQYLFLTALLHDIGKGFGRNHAEKGADLIRTICRRMGIKESTAGEMAFLIRYHLFLVEIAMRRDLGDEKVIIECAQTIQTEARLDMLYLLTVADGLATGPRSWNEWKAALVDELFLKVKRILAGKELAGPDATSRVNRIILEVKGLLRKEGPEPDHFDHLNNMPESYILAMGSSRLIAKHIRMAEELGAQKFLLSAEAKHKFWEVTILAKDRPGLFSHISGVFTLNDLDILKAQIFTLRNGIAIDIFHLKELLADSFDQQRWGKVKCELEKALTGRFSLEYRLAEKSMPLPLEIKKRKTPSKILIDNDSSDFYTIIEIYTSDRPGLLFTLSKALFDAGLDIKSAKISTKVDQIVDVFYVTDMYGQKVDHPEQFEELKKALLFKVDGSRNDRKCAIEF